MYIVKCEVIEMGRMKDELRHFELYDINYI